MVALGRWYCVACVEEFAGDWDALAERLADRSGLLHSGPDAEANFSHLDDVVSRLDAAGLDASEVMEPEPFGHEGPVPGATQRLRPGLGGRDYTEAVINTPRRRLRRRALRGAWQAFPLDPAGPFELLAAAWEDRDHVSNQATVRG